MSRTIIKRGTLSAIADVIRSQTGDSALVPLADFETYMESLGSSEFVKSLVGRTLSEIHEGMLEGVTSIGKYAFSNLVSLVSVTLPSNLRRVNEHAFRGCTALTDVFFQSTDTWIRSYLFEGCTSLADFVLPKWVVGIGGGAFWRCIALSSINLENVQQIEASAFRYCKALTSVSLPSVSALGLQSFAECTALISATLSEGLTEISDGCFSDCTSLEVCELPSTTTRIGSAAFSKCGKYVISIPDNVQEIGENAFWKCEANTHIVIPASVTAIGSHAFFIEAMESLEVDSGNPVYHSAGKCLIHTASKQLVQGYPNSVIPDDGSVTSIAYRAFSHFTNITSMTIPASIRVIGKAIFDVTNISTVIMLGEVPPTLEEHFGWRRTGGTAPLQPTIIVPAGCGGAYKTATNWSQFADYIQEAT